MKPVPMKKTLAILLMLASLTAVAQETSVANTDYSSSDTEDEMAIRAQMAMTTGDYRVTAGDVYRVVYLAGIEAVNFSFVVDLSYKVRIANLGVVDASGLTYLQFKRRVEDLVTRNYPLGGVQVALIAPATFTVTVRGEVHKTFRVAVWGLQRLSSVMKNLTGNASIRDIEIERTDGTKKTVVCDLFRAERDGDSIQDPYLRPDDLITIKKIRRAVTLSGAVNRPGTYQLLEGENLADLVAVYGDGLSPVADTTRIELVRYVDSGSVSGDKLFFGKDALDNDLELNHLDTVTIASRRDLIPVMYLEGAIGVPGNAGTQVSQRKEIRFNAGENYASLVRNNRAQFTSISDTKNAYIVRGEERITINLNPILYDSAYRSDYTVENEDILVVPFRQFFVTVTGAVMSPGRYPYIPDRDWEYYIALAGGFNKERNSFESIRITDMQGNKLTKKSAIPPECIIDAKNSTFIYYFNKYSPVIVTTLGIIVSYYTVKDLINSN